MTAGSTSTWPKSGLTETSRVRLLLRPPLRSNPALAPASCPVRNGSPATAGLRVALVRAKGEISSRPPAAMPARPVRSAKREARPLTSLGTQAKWSSSFLRLMSRWKLTPQTWTPVPLKRSWLKGMRISTVHPASSMRAALDQTPSQVELVSVSFEIVPSSIEPRGLTPK
jgi:hypothetical protein